MNIETKTQRARLAIRKNPYWARLGDGIGLGYRRNDAAMGTWNVRISDGKGGYTEKRLAAADDIGMANGRDIMTYVQARDAALRFSPGKADIPLPVSTLKEAIDAYEADLSARGADLSNAARLRHNISHAMLKRPVALIDTKELLDWRNAIAKRLEPSGVNRLMAIFRAVLNLAAKTATQKLDADVWKNGLAALPHATEANNVVLPEETVIRLVHAAREYGPEFGLLVEVLAQTGARYSQIARCNVRDLAGTRLMIPSSFKGRGSKKQVRVPVPLPDELVDRLRETAAGRPLNAPLLLKKSGERWAPKNIEFKFAKVIEAIGEDPREITSYALRHTHITRQLLRGFPVTLVAKRHDTSVQMIEDHYAAEIANQEDSMERSAMLQFDRPQDNVVPLRVPASK